MTKTEIIQKVKQLIIEGKTDDSLDVLIPFLESDERYKELLTTAQIIQSNFNELQQQQLRGTIDRDDYTLEHNKIKEKILGLLDELEEGVTKPVLSRRMKTWLPVLIGLVLIFGIWWMIGDNKNRKDFTAKFPPCPAFEEPSDFNLLILPFLKKSGAEALFDFELKKKIDDFSGDLKKKLRTLIHKDYPQEDLRNIDFDLAGQIGNECQAGMIVWGDYEQLTDNYLVSISYKFLGDQDSLGHELSLEGSSETVSLKSVSGIQNEGSLTGNIEAILKMVLCMVAYSNEAYELVAQQWEGIGPGDKNNPQNKDAQYKMDWILAESYVRTNQWDKANKIYDRIVQDENQAQNIKSLALNNRGTVHLNAQKYDQAVNDFESAYKLAPDNINLVLRKSEAYTRKGDYIKAQRELEEAKNKDPDNPKIDQQNQRIKKTLEDNVRSQPSATNFMNRAMYFQLNDEPVEAEKDLKNAIDKKPRDEKIVAAYYNILIKNGKNAQAERLRAKARSDGLDMQKFERLRSLPPGN